MADLAKNVSGGLDRGIVSNTPKGKGNHDRKRTVYAHVMTPTDKVALRTVLAAKNVCTALAVAIQDGKPVKAETMQACLMLQNEAMSMLF